MALTSRGPQRRGYVYRSVRDGSTVRKVYIGATADPAVELAHRSHRLNEAVRIAEREQRSREIELAKRSAIYLDVIAAVAAKWRVLEKLFVDQPQWGMGTVPAHGLSDPYGWAGENRECLVRVQQMMRFKLMSPAKIKQLCRDAAANDPVALQRLVELVDDQQELFAGAVDLLAVAREFVIEAIAGDSPANGSAVDAKIATMLRELDHGLATDALERMLTEIAAVAWLDAMTCSVQCTRAGQANKGADFWSIMATRSQKRWQEASKALEAYRIRLRRRAT